MARLIDADDLIKEINKKMPQGSARGVFKAFIDEQPTAYNVENVVEEIRKQFGCKDCEYADVFPTPAVCSCECAELEVINDICDIVKRGGVDERT